MVAAFPAFAFEGGLDFGEVEDVVDVVAVVGFVGFAPDHAVFSEVDADGASEVVVDDLNMVFVCVHVFVGWFYFSEEVAAGFGDELGSAGVAELSSFFGFEEAVDLAC